ncbi:MAG: FHIPEP family type III secretion protein [Candidatus Eremiobacteraeota bacterium]|nr:FHIPEP family type III secretion protein [Candidatus Eremiobacteraeota bacterium]
MHFSPVWSALGATSGKWRSWLSAVIWKGIKALPLLALLVPVRGQVLDSLVLLSLLTVLVGGGLSFCSKEPLNLQLFHRLPRLCLWLQSLLLVLFVKLLFTGFLFGPSSSKTGFIISGAGRLLVCESPQFSVAIFGVLLLLQRKTSRLSELLRQAAARFRLDVFPMERYSLDARLESKKLTAEDWEQEWNRLHSRLESQEWVGELGVYLQQSALLINLPIVTFVAVRAVCCSLTEGASPWLPSVSIIVGGMALLSTLSFVWAFLMGMCLKESKVYYIHPECAESFPGRREMVTGLFGLGIETVALAGLGLPPGTSLALKLLIGGKYSVELEPEIVVLPETSTREVTSPSEMSVKLGRDLISLVDPTKDSKLLEMMPSLREQFQSELGFVFEHVRFRDGLALKPLQYQIWLGENAVGEWEFPDHTRLLALGPEGLLRKMNPTLVKEPLFGLPACWVEVTAFESVCAFFAPHQVIASHLLEVARSQARLLLTKNMASHLLSGWSKSLPEGDLPRFTRVLSHLVGEGISVEPLPHILESFLSLKDQLPDDLALVQEIRIALSGKFCETLCSDSGRLHVLSTEPSLVSSLRNGMRKDQLESLCQGLHLRFQTLWEGGMQPIIVTQRDVRQRLGEIAATEDRQARVLCWDELRHAKVNILGTI